LFGGRWPGLGFFQRARLVAAWCEARADFRSFRPDRITSWETLHGRLPRPRRALLREWWQREQIPDQL
jgi:predicted DNA-binding transcriptional regulator YafY